MKGNGGTIDPKAVRRERESFIVLQHLHNLRGEATDEARLCSRVERDLGFEPGACAELVEHLVRVGFATTSGPGDHLWITPAGAEYIERLAWRRRSVRAPAPAE